MPYQTNDDFQTRGDIEYGFFTTESGSSSAGYVINGERTRNVNLYSVKEGSEERPSMIVDNIARCLEELGGTLGKEDRGFYMTSNYAAGGEAKVVTITEETLFRAYEESKLLMNLSLDAGLAAGLQASNIGLVKADAVVFNKIPGRRIAVGGAGGDAHPIILIDEVAGVCAYIAGAHAAIHAGAYEKAVAEMTALGASVENIHTLVGPGLGPRSYEFGRQIKRPSDGEIITTREYFADSETDSAVIEVARPNGEEKCLVDMPKLLKQKSRQLGLKENHFHDMALDTLGYDAYDAVTHEFNGGVDFSQLAETGPLFFSARRQVKMDSEDVAEANTGLHSKSGRHFSLVITKG